MVSPGAPVTPHGRAAFSDRALSSFALPRVFFGLSNSLIREGEKASSHVERFNLPRPLSDALADTLHILLSTYVPRSASLAPHLLQVGLLVSAELQ